MRFMPSSQRGLLYKGLSKWESHKLSRKTETGYKQKLCSRIRPLFLLTWKSEHEKNPIVDDV